MIDRDFDTDDDEIENEFDQDTGIEHQFITVTIAEKNYAFPIRDLVEIIIIPNEVHPLPNMPATQRGIFRLRDKIVPLLDTRKKMGMTSRYEEGESLVQLLAQKKQDHLDWIDELEASIKENREFTKTTDPHLCAFGKWYDNFKAANHVLAHQLKRFDKPHKEIHALAKVFLDVKNKEGKEAALALCQKARKKELVALFKIFEDVTATLRQTSREVGLVFQFNGKPLALTVDNTEHVKVFEPHDIEAFNGGVHTPSYVKGVYKSDTVSVIVIDEKEILTELAAN